MSNHIDILTLLDYARGKITDDAVFDQIADHLGSCNHCLKILHSHDHLIKNHEEVMEMLFPPAPMAEEPEKIPVKPNAGGGVSITPVSGFFNKQIHDLLDQAVIMGGEMRDRVLEVIEELKFLTTLQERLIPVASINFLGMDDRKVNPEKLHLINADQVRLHLASNMQWNLEDFVMEFTGVCFYLIYDKEDYQSLVGQKITMATNEIPYLLFATFEGAGSSAIAKFEIAIEKMNDPGDEDHLKEEKNLDLYVFIHDQPVE